MHKFVGFVATMHYNSYVPELDFETCTICI